MLTQTSPAFDGIGAPRGAPRWPAPSHAPGAARIQRSGAVTQRRSVDNLEIGAVELLKLMEVVVVPACGRRASHVPG